MVAKILLFLGLLVVIKEHNLLPTEKLWDFTLFGLSFLPNIKGFEQGKDRKYQQ